MLNIERSIYNLVKKNPRIKNQVRNYYQLAMSLFPAKEMVINDSLINRSGFFFGFHDKIPWSAGNKKLLANKFSIPNRKITRDDTIEIGTFAGQDFKDFKPLGVTKSFNWQQGCMLQWVGSTDQIIFNDFDGNKHISRLIDTNGTGLKKFDEPVAAISPDGKHALSYSFTRLAKFAPGYGYENGREDDNHLQAPATQYLKLLDLETATTKNLFSLKDIAAIDPDPSMENAFHYFTHGLFSPSAERFVFYHRWIREMNFVNTRMFSCNMDGSDLFLFPTNGMVSHIGWKDNDKLLAYCSTKKYGDAYTLFHDRSEAYLKTGDSILNSDGHPSYDPADSNFFITDTYPDRQRLITLILFDHLHNKRTDLAKLRQPLSFRDELRCDFHPRWNRDGTEMTSMISPLVQVCDAISGARPGARREVVEQYIKRLKDLEALALSYNGVEKSYAIQAGRELRVVVESEKISDKQAEVLSHEIATKIQTEMTYPGQVKVTVIRETRAVNYAK